MTDPSDRNDAADTRHWRRSLRLAAGLGLAWLVLAFGPLVFARQLSFEIAGAPLVIWICSLGAPVGFVLLVWRYERVMDRLDRERREGRAEA